MSHSLGPVAWSHAGTSKIVTVLLTDWYREWERDRPIQYVF